VQINGDAEHRHDADARCGSRLCHGLPLARILTEAARCVRNSTACAKAHKKQARRVS
jgi:hypothetical protein